jgi:alpha-galactosidase
MRDALNRTQRRILFSTEPFDLTPNPQAHIANMWRTTTDVADTTMKVRVNIDLNDKWAEFAGPGGFNGNDKYAQSTGQ